MLSVCLVFSDNLIVCCHVRIAIVVPYFGYFVPNEVSFHVLALVDVVPLVSYRDHLFASRFDADNVCGVIDPQREW